MGNVDTNTNSQITGLETAVIGMAGRFPGARNIDEFWENLKHGVESITFFSDKELEAAGVKPELPGNSAYVKAEPILEDIECFDATFFEYPPREAELMDPQLRILHECAWEALEDAGYDPNTYSKLIGFYAGAAANIEWLELSLSSGKTAILGNLASQHLMDRDFLSTRIAHRLNLKGPAITVQTACSTALVAVHLASQGLLSGDCDLALAGGVTVSQLKKQGYLYQEGMIFSPDGHCRAFDANAQGAVFGNGVGLVVLKRLDDAVAEGDHIYAVIKGSAINNDGITKASYTAPGIYGQEEVIRSALQMAEVEPGSISYVETHGTGTPLGDPVEIEGLKQAFDTNKKGFCALGSVKTNMGHLDIAAGIAGLIKTVLALRHRLIPPSLHFNAPNPKIKFENCPFYVNTEAKEWKNDKYPLRAGVSSFGIGGTNAHLILEQAPEQTSSDPPGRAYQLILLSARTANALEQASKNLKDYLKENPHTNLADAAFTLNTGRKAFEHKKMLVCKDVNEALHILEQEQQQGHEEQLIRTHYTKEEKRAIFMFPGQGSQYVDMARGVYETEPIFRQEMDRCFEILKPLMGYDLKEIIYPVISPQSTQSTQSENFNNKTSAPSASSAVEINQTEIAQPLIFASEYALAKLLMAWGITPYAMMGHSIGEYTAACLAGVFSLEDALFIVAWRGKLMQQMPPGSMLSVALPEPELKQLLSNEAEGKLDLAAVNGPSQCVVSGTHEDIDAFARQLGEKNIQTRKLHTSHAYHSKMMEPILPGFREKVSQIKVNAPQIPFISNLTGKWCTFQDVTDSNYWVRHLRSTVRFADGLKELLKDKNVIFIEVGPGSTIATFTRQHPDKSPNHMLINLVRHPNEDVPDEYYLLSKLGQTWLYGKSIDWQQFYSREKRHRLHLPTYPFQHQRYWIEVNPDMMIRERMIRGILPGKNPDMSQWFYIPSWKRSIIARGNKEENVEKIPAPHKWLVFAHNDDVNHGNLASLLVERLTHEKENGSDSDGDVTVVKIGDSFARHQDGSYTIAPAQENHYETLIEELQSTGKIPDRIVHLWNLSPALDENQEPVKENERVEKSLDLGFYSLIYLAKALGKQPLNREIHITVLTNGMQEVWGETVVFPGKAVVLAPVMITPREYPDIKCRCIDIVLPEPGSEQGKKKAVQNNENKLLMDRLIREFKTGISHKDTIIAYRGNYRLVRTFEPIRLSPLNSQPPALRLRKSGVYLITGGLGGIGLVLARYLAKTLQAKLILTGRSAFPAHQEWEQWLDTHGSLDRVSQKIRKIKELEALGAEVRVYSVDSTDGPAMSGVIAQTRQHFGTINGVIHSAGVPGGGIIQLKTRELADRVLAPKIKGTLALHRALQDQGIRPDFIVLCSSVNSVVPIIGQVDYCAANAFMDAFAFYNNARDNGSTFTVSINWDAWQEVGMAVEAAKQSAGDNQGKTSAPRPLDHPLLDHYVPGTPRGEMIYTTYFSLNRHWVLRDHSTNEGKGLAPGVTYLEMAHAAIKNQTKTGNSIVEMRSVSFLNPLMVKKDEEQEVRMILTPMARGFEFRVSSRLIPGENTWQDHATGEVAAAAPPQEEPKTHDLQAIKARCYWEEIDADSSLSRVASKAADSLIIFGPHWGNLKKIKAGKNEGLALLELPAEFTAELNQFALYPALLDNAAGFLYSCINRESPYIPYSYKRLRVSAPLPARVYSYSRWLEEEDGAPMDFLKFNIIIMDETGRELVNIEEFTMLEVSPEILARLKEKEQGALPGAAPVQALGDSQDTHQEETSREELLKDGILPREGVEIFTRILETRDALTQVVVSTRDLESRMETSQIPESPGAVDWMPGTRTNDAVHARPDISTPYIAPTTSLQQKLANIWQELLGITRVGIKDDFFELGGDSLKAATLIARIKKEFHTNLSVRNIFNAPNVKDLSKLMEIPVEPDATPSVTSIEPLEKKEYYAASAMQKKLYLLNQMEGIGTAYNLAFGYILQGKLDRQRLELTFQLLVQRHESLRTSFAMVGNEPVQIIHQTDDLNLQISYWVSDYEIEDHKLNDLILTFSKPFDLTRTPLLRIGLVKLAEEKHLFIFDVHHIVSDATSIMIMIRDFTVLYENEGKNLPGLKLRYKDFAVWQNNQPGKAAMKKQEEYWLNQFKGDIPLLQLYMDYPRPMIQNFAGERINFHIDQALTEKLNQLIKETKTTLFIMLLAVFNILLSKYAGQEDIIVGAPIAGRQFADLENINGIFINTLPIRNYPAANKTFVEFLKEVKQNSLNAFENQGYPFAELIEKLDLNRDISRNPLYDVELIVQNVSISQSSIKMKGTKVIPLPYEAMPAQVDISLEAMEVNERIEFSLTYCTKLFKRETIDKFFEFFKKIISVVVENKEIKLEDIAVPQQLEKAQLNIPQTGEITFGF
jgi:acyl transferase domain-containing protein/acyl carrier protein